MCTDRIGGRRQPSCSGFRHGSRERSERALDESASMRVGSCFGERFGYSPRISQLLNYLNTYICIQIFIVIVFFPTSSSLGTK